jgi:hypothetical protein
MKTLKISAIVASFIFCMACNRTDSNRNHGNNSPAANMETDSTGLLPKENVKTAEDGYRDTNENGIAVPKAEQDKTGYGVDTVQQNSKVK